MESFREDGAVISETNVNRVTHIKLEDEEGQDLEVYDDEQADLSGDQVDMGCIKQFQDMESSDEEYPSDIGEIFGDDWIGKPGVSSESDSEDLPKNKSQVEPKKKRVRGQPIPSNITIVEGQPLKYKCTVCIKTFSSKGHIRYHAYCAQSEKPFKCNLCSKSFSKKSLLDYHIKTHTGERPYPCTMCEKSFLQLDKLKRHKRIHFGSYLKCDQCDKKFRDSNSLNVHKRSHIDSNSSRFTCNNCSKNFKGKSALNVHIRAVHSSSKQFFCEHCGKGFDWKYNLVCHVRTHSGVRAYSCKECNKTFKNQQDCCKHRLTHTENKEYRCQVCEGAFKRRDNLIRHLRNIHPEEEMKIVKVATPNQSSIPEVAQNVSESLSGSTSNSGQSSTLRTKNINKTFIDSNSLKTQSTSLEGSNEKKKHVSNIVFSGTSKFANESKVVNNNLEKVPSEACQTPGDSMRTNSCNIIYRESKIMPGESDKIPSDLSRIPMESSKIPNEFYQNQTTKIRFVESGIEKDEESNINNNFNIRLQKHANKSSVGGHSSKSILVLNDTRLTKESNHQSNYLRRIVEDCDVDRTPEHYLLLSDQGGSSRDAPFSNISYSYYESSYELPINPDGTLSENSFSNMASHRYNHLDPSSLNNIDSQRISVIRNLSPPQSNSAQSSVIKHSGNTNSLPPSPTLQPPSSSRECVIKSTKL